MHCKGHMNAEKTCIVHSIACVQYVYRALICNSWSNMGPRLPEDVTHLQFVSEVAHLQFVSEMAQLQFVSESGGIAPFWAPG